MDIQYIPPSDWQEGRLICQDKYGNRGEVRFPHENDYYGGGWTDAQVNMRSRLEGSADDTAAAAEFAYELAHMAKTLDLAFADESKAVIDKQEAEEREEELERKARDAAEAKRCEDVAQFYMQLVRVQREGHSSMAKGELHVVTVKDSDGDVERVQPRMWLRESNGNRWEFYATQISKFELKNGQRYEEVSLTPMAELEAEARKLVAA